VVLVVDDDEQVLRAMARGLESEGFVVDAAVEAEAALRMFEPSRHDVLVVDLLMPRGSGMALLQQIRAVAPTPVIFLSGHGDDASRVAALELGAADFVAKPVVARELALRIRNVLGRGSSGQADEVLEYAGLELRPHRREARLAGELLDLTGKEYELLEHFVRSPGKVFSREALLQQVWGSNLGWQSPTTVTEHVYRLRQKLERGPSPRLLHTVRGSGYCFGG
jgi:DNA-binding response OmpR family regulator